MEDNYAFSAFEDAPADVVKRGRGGARDSMMLTATMVREDGMGSEVQLRVRNVSPGGIMADSLATIERGARVIVEMRNIGEVRGVIAWAREGRIGIAFEREIDPLAARKPVGTGKGLNTHVPPRAGRVSRPGIGGKGIAGKPAGGVRND